MPEGAIEGTQYLIGCSIPGLAVLSWIFAPL